MLTYKHSLYDRIYDQIKVFEQLKGNSIEIFFNESDTFPSKEDLQNFFTITEKSIQDSNNNEYFIEIQLILFLTIIQGVSLKQALSFNYRDYYNLENLEYQGKDLKINSKNNYCDHLINKIRKLGNGSESIFSILNNDNVTQYLNLFLVMNGYEYSLSENKLTVIFGRFLYLRHGQIRSIREFLKKYFSCDSHIDLLVELKLVDSIHYNTMCRN